MIFDGIISHNIRYPGSAFESGQT